MNTLTVGGNILAIVNRFGINVIIKSVSMTANGVVVIAKKILTYDQPFASIIINDLKKLDLDNEVEIVEKLVMEQIDNQYPESVEVALNKMDMILKDINQELDIINNKMDTHSQLYFSNWRTLDCKKNIENLYEYKNIFYLTPLNNKHFQFYIKLN